MKSILLQNPSKLPDTDKQSTTTDINLDGIYADEFSPHGVRSTWHGSIYLVQ